MEPGEKNGGDKFPSGAGLQEPGQGLTGPWLREAGVCALGVLIGFVLGLAASPSSMSSASLPERATAEPAAPSTQTANHAVMPGGPVSRRHALPDTFAVPSPSTAAAAVMRQGGPRSGTDPLPSIGGMETCWSTLETVTC